VIDGAEMIHARNSSIVARRLSVWFAFPQLRHLSRIATTNFVTCVSSKSYNYGRRVLLKLTCTHRESIDKLSGSARFLSMTLFHHDLSCTIHHRIEMLSFCHIHTIYFLLSLRASSVGGEPSPTPTPKGRLFILSAYISIIWLAIGGVCPHIFF